MSSFDTMASAARLIPEPPDFLPGLPLYFAGFATGAKAMKDSSNLYLMQTRKTSLVNRRDETTFKKGKNLKLTDTEVEQILTCGGSDTETAKRFSVSQVYVSKLRRGEARRYVYERVVMGKEITTNTNLARAFSDCYKIDEKTGCWNWTGSVNKDGYGITFPNIRAHRESYEIHNGPIPPGLCVCHKCNNKLCVNPDHLYAATNSVNTQHAVRDGLFPKGSSNHAAKLSEDQVMEIRDSGLSKSALAAKYNVSRGLIGHIKKRRSWKHLPDPDPMRGES